MRAFFIAAAFWLACLVPASAGYGTPTTIYVSTGAPFNSGTAVGPTTADAPIGSLVWLEPSSFTTNGVSVTSVTDTAGNSYSIIQSVATELTLSFAYSITTNDLPIGSTFTVTMSDGSQYGLNFNVYSVSGVASLDVSTAFTSTSGGTSVSLSSGTLGTSSDLLIGSVICNGASCGTVTESSGFTNLTGAGALSFGSIGTDQPASTTSATYHPSWTSSHGYSAVLVAFKPLATTPCSLTLVGVGKC
ncbi:MAG TPA: hypothetical protein VHY10_16385 [Xanthobacteraceae bacterium]|jgi:hypothetical protein|nr:hypothetical protein [Xanthobacteraceae bacterium]